MECNAMGIKHEPHVWDFGSGEEFTCPGDADGFDPVAERHIRPAKSSDGPAR